jgi:hypothetical protein
MSALSCCLLAANTATAGAPDKASQPLRGFHLSNAIRRASSFVSSLAADRRPGGHNLEAHCHATLADVCPMQDEP